MTSSVTIWTSSSTNHAKSLVAQNIRAAHDLALAYDSISVVGCNVEETAQHLSDAFRRLVTMTMSDPTLHIIAVVPLYEDNSIEQIKMLCDACSAVEHNITLHVLGLCVDLRKIFDSKEDRAASEKVQAESVVLLKKLCNEKEYSLSYSLIDDFTETGAPIRFTLNSLSQYIAHIQVALMQNYYEILSPALLDAHRGDNLSVGVSSLSFDRDSTANQLLGLGFMAALDNVGINNNEVDLQKAAHEAETLLAGIEKRYPTLYARYIRLLYREQGMNKNQTAVKAAEILDADIAELKLEILNLLKREDLSFPEKEAILAMILGRDNENLRGMQYQHEGLLLDDAYNEPVNRYIEVFNKHCLDLRLLPVRGDFEMLKKYKWNKTTGQYEETIENKLALNPIHEIKRLKQDILNTTSFLREKQDELVSIQKTVALREDAEEIKHKWHKPKGNLNIEYKEQPLDDKYTPSQGMKVAETVDLRKFFTPVRNQQNLGSCSSFATVSMYEAMMNRNGVQGENMMSPAYLFYYSNVLTGRPSGGSNYFEQLEVLGKHGVCYDSLYAYDADSSFSKPSDEAEKDAETHRVIAAKQIPLINETQSDTLKHNHKLITSALSEGYPVGISLKIYDNFGKSGAFILHPDDAPDAKEDGWHAMVIVGYSETNSFYIVRNSWGTDFGEEGYCYIPMAYIDDPEYMSFACIITEISDSASRTKDIPTVLAKFGATETEIKIAAIRNIIASVRAELKNTQMLYAEYYKYYQRLIQQLTIPNTQNKIREYAENAQVVLFAKELKERQELEDSFVSKLKGYKKYLIGVIILLFVVALCFGLLWYFSEIGVCGVLSLFFVTLGAFTWPGYKWWVRIRRKQLRDELGNQALNEKYQAEKLLDMQIEFHVAGMWIRSFHKLSTDIGTVYERLVSYNDTLRAWKKNYYDQNGLKKDSESQMFRLLDASPMLESFFETHKEKIVERIDLLDVFDDYRANIQDLEDSHAQLRQLVKEAIIALMEDFNMANYLLGDRYPFLCPANIQEEIDILLKVGLPTYKNKAMNATSPIRIVMVNVEQERASMWETRTLPFFPMRPIQLTLIDPTMLLLITVHPQEIN